MAKNKSFSVIKVDLSGLSTESRIHLNGAITRWVCSKYGRVFASEDNGIIFTDLEGSAVNGLLHICEVNGAKSSIRLVAPAFFEKLFAGEAL